MCVVSMLGDWGHQWTPQPSNPLQPLLFPVPGITWTPEMFKQFIDLMDRVRELEAATGVVDCEDPEKFQWLEDVKKTFDPNWM